MNPPIIRIRNFKKISEELIINDFKQVNYLVGKNGSGKSSFLSAVSHLNDNSNARRFFRADSIVEMLMEGKKRFLVWNDSDPNKTSSTGDLKLEMRLLSTEKDNEKGANGIAKITGLNYSNVKDSKYTFDLLNNTLDTLGHSELQISINDKDPWDQPAARREFHQDGREIDPAYFAQGLMTFSDFRYAVKTALDGVSKIGPGQSDALVILIEEPENNLHPDLQKRVPEFIEDSLNQLATNKDRVFFVVATHSPFIIGSASNLGHKVYLFDEGKLHKQQTGLQNFVSVVSSMLGAEITDLGYPENYCIVEEASLQHILQTASLKGILRNIQFVSAKGWSPAASMSERISQIESINMLIKCNPYYFSKYFLVLDNAASFGTKEKARVEKLKSNLQSRFIELTNQCIEDYYPLLNNQLHTRFLAEPPSGATKEKYSKEVAVMIDTPADFSKLFNGELDFLLRK